MAAGGVCAWMWPVPWIFAVSIGAGALCYPVEAGKTAVLEKTSLRKERSREVVLGMVLLSGVFLVLYGLRAEVGYERWFLTAVLLIGAVLPVAERESTWQLWMVLSILYAAAWGAAGYYGPEVLWPVAFVQLVVCGGVKPVLAAQHYIS